MFERWLSKYHNLWVTEIHKMQVIYVHFHHWFHHLMGLTVKIIVISKKKYLKYFHIYLNPHKRIKLRKIWQKIETRWHITTHYCVVCIRCLLDKHNCLSFQDISMNWANLLCWCICWWLHPHLPFNIFISKQHW